MKNNWPYIITLILLIAANLVDVTIDELFHLPMVAKHGIHLATLTFCAIAGYRYWRNDSVQPIWLLLYAIIAVLIVGNYLLFFFMPKVAVYQWKAIVAQLRNGFAGPLPFLVFTLLRRLMRGVPTGN